MNSGNRNPIERLDLKLIYLLRNYGDEFGRFALFFIFFYFGFLKLFDLSPAGPLVVELLGMTFLNFIPASTFLILWGLFEMLIGVLALIPKLERITFALLAFHLFTTVMPLFMLTHVTWSEPFVPTLTGQYIMKNMALLSISLLLFARLRPMAETHSLFGGERRR